MRSILVPHPDSPRQAVRNIAVEARRAGTRLSLRYAVDGDMGQVVLPPAGERRRTDGLWRHTCFEVFVSAGQGYAEINLAPSGQWASYAFDAYRSGMAQAEGFEPSVLTDARSAETYDLIAEFDLSDLPADAVWSVGLSAVIEQTDGARCYWALRHVAGAPDFHHPDAFALSLPSERP